MRNLTDFMSKMFVLSVLIFTLTSCVQDVDTEIADPEIKSSFEAELEEILDDMEEDSALALEKLDKLILKAERINSKYYTGKAKWYKGYIYDEVVEDVSLAYHNYSEALKDILQTDDASLKMKIYNNLGILYRFYDQHDAAIINYKAALELKDDLTIDQLSDIYFNYGVALKLKGDSVSFFEAEQAFTKSLEYAQQIDYHENIASVHNQIGLMYKAIEDYEMARSAYNNTIRTYINNPNLQGYVGKAFHGIGVTYMEEENIEASVKAFEEALLYKRNSGSIFITKYDLGTVLLSDGRADDAITVWRDALNEKHNKNSIEQVQIYSDLTSALKMENQYKAALGYSEIYNSNIQKIMEEGEKYKSESDQVLFANVVKEYDEFNKAVPFFSRPLVLFSTILAIIMLIYLTVVLYYRSRSAKKVSEVVSKIQTEFQHVMVD